MVADGVTHVRDCPCSRCEAGYGPSEQQRQDAARIWRAHVNDERARVAAQRLVLRHERRLVAQALALQSKLDRQERRVDETLERERAMRERMLADDRLARLLEARRAGASAAGALAQAEDEAADESPGDASSSPRSACG
jgi:hypothetical protein